MTHEGPVMPKSNLKAVEAVEAIEDAAGQLSGRTVPMLTDDFHQALGAKLVAIPICRLGDAVGEDQEYVSVFYRHSPRLVRTAFG